MSHALKIIRSLSRNVVAESGRRVQSRLVPETIASTTSAATLRVRGFSSVCPALAVTTGETTPNLHHSIIKNSKSTFSSIAEQEDESLATTTTTSKPKRQRPKRKDPITITPAAADRIKEILSSPNGEGALGIRLGVKRRGCNGLSYTLNYAFEKESNEEIMEAHGVKVMIEPMALFSVVGTVMDWEETDMSSEFTFENPNSKGECGCGESFNV